MPLATLHLISLTPSTTLKSFLSSIKSLPDHDQPITTSKVIKWIITPEIIDTTALLQPKKPYDLLLIFPNTNPLPSTLTSKIHDHFHLQVGIPSRLLKNYTETNINLLHPPSKSKTPTLTGSLNKPILKQSSQSLSLSTPLQSWINQFSTTKPGQSPISMLNLLSFIPERKQDYLRYGQEFAKGIGSRRGGNAKLVGHAVYPPTSPRSSLSSTLSSTSESSSSSGQYKWDEFALAHYPSILHFADMLASEDYQAVNQKYRVPSLRDTCILCTSEIAVEDYLMEIEMGKEGEVMM